MNHEVLHILKRVKICDHGVSCEECCWLWVGGLDRTGYGKIRFRNKQIGPHRALFIAYTRLDLPSSKHILHACDTPLCCNWNHLFIGDNKLNMYDKKEKGRAVKGSQQSQSKLTEDNVRLMRKMYKTGEYTQIDLGKLFGVRQSVANRIFNYQDWSHVKDEEVA